MILCILFLMECICPSQNVISDVLLCFLIPFSEIVSFVSYEKELFGSKYTSTLYQMGVSLEILTKWYTVEE
jgi:hypothetical protein